MLLLLLYLGATLALYLAPLGIDSPCFLEQSQLPPKPALFGHRGAPMVSPSLSIPYRSWNEAGQAPRRESLQKHSKKLECLGASPDRGH